MEDPDGSDPLPAGYDTRARPRALSWKPAEDGPELLTYAEWQARQTPADALAERVRQR